MYSNIKQNIKLCYAMTNKCTYLLDKLNFFKLKKLLGHSFLLT